MTFLKTQGVRGLVGKLLVPAAGCKPKLDFWDCLKAISERAQRGHCGLALIYQSALAWS